MPYSSGSLRRVAVRQTVTMDCLYPPLAVASDPSGTDTIRFVVIRLLRASTPIELSATCRKAHRPVPDLVPSAWDVAESRARNVTAPANNAGMSRVGLNKAFFGASPPVSLAAVLKVTKAFGLTGSFRPPACARNEESEMDSEYAARGVLVLREFAGKKMVGADTAKHDTPNGSVVSTFGLPS